MKDNMEEESEISGISLGEEDDNGEPLSLSVRQFLAARVSEITSLTAQLGNSGGGGGRAKGFSFQHVSKHMRRRAVSHNPKRLPSRLRTSHLAQLRKSSGGVVKKPKKPRRKHRRRSDGDILEYNRRQLVNPMWLESHIWHAKRFHMKPLWNRKVAIAPTSKCFRSLFRAARQNVIMQDISYMCSLEISGPIHLIREGMSKLMMPYSVFHANPQWNKEYLAHIATLTSNYLGPVKYLWISGALPSNGKLLVWLHPTIKTYFIDELISTFKLIEQKTELNFPEFPNKDEKKHLWKIVNNQWWLNEKTLVSLKDVGGCFNRIRLTGPKTLTVLKQVLKIGKPSFEEMGSSPEDTLEEQKSLWKRIQKIVNIPDSTVIPLNVIDPRWDLPDKRRRVTKDSPTEESKPNEEKASNWHQVKMDSPIWQEDKRRMILHNKTSEETLSKMRSNNLVPGTSISGGSDNKSCDVVPIVLITRSSNFKFPGMDVILPCGWLMPFWIGLSYRCVRSYALEFNDYLTFEEDPYVQDFSTCALFSPDSIIYTKENEKTEKDAKANYFKYPPAKRHNLIKLGCAFPFSIDWTRFLKLSTEDNTAVVEVVRNLNHLRTISKCLRQLTYNLDDLLINSKCKNQLFPIQVVLLSGAVEKCACICLPTKEDLANLFSFGHQKYPVQQQPFKDTNEKKRFEITRLHHKRLANLRKKRKVARRAAAGDTCKNFDLRARLHDLDSKAEVEKYNREINNLWLNDNPEEVILKQDRKIIGFTEYAHFSFLRGKSAGSGYIVVGELEQLLKVQSKENIERSKGHKGVYVLVRNWASSLTYYWAKLEYPAGL